MAYGRHYKKCIFADMSPICDDMSVQSLSNFSVSTCYRTFDGVNSHPVQRKITSAQFKRQRQLPNVPSLPSCLSDTFYMKCHGHND